MRDFGENLRVAFRALRSSTSGSGSVYAIVTICAAICIAGIIVWGILSQQSQQTLTLYSGQKGGTYYPLAVEIAKLLERENPGVRVNVRESEGSLQNLRNVANDTRGKALGIVQNDVYVPANLTSDSASSVRSLLPLHQGVLHFLVRADSEIFSVADLPGKVIADGLPESGSPRIVGALLNHYEIPEGAVERRQLSLTEACDQFRAGEVDAIMMAMGLKSRGFEELVADVSLRFVGIGESINIGSEIEGFRLTYPFVQATMIPKYAYSAPAPNKPGVPGKAVPAIAMRAVLIGHEDLHDLTANRIARSLIENKSSLSRSHPSAAQITEKFDPTQLQFPIHGGAHRYFHRDDPGFLQRNAEVLGFILSLIIAATGFFLSLQRWLRRLRKNRIDAYYIHLDQLIHPLHESELSREQLIELERKLQQMQRRAIRQLAQEKLIADESFRIFQALLLDGREEVRRQLES